MKRILFLIKGLQPGGAERLVASAATRLDVRRFECEVAYLLPERNTLVGDLEQVGVRVLCLAGGRGAAWLERLRTVVDERGIALVHAHSPYAAAGARLALWRTRVPLVYTEHAEWSAYHPLTYWANALSYARNDHVFAVSDRVRGSIRYPRPLRFLPMPPVETLYHGIERADAGAAMPPASVRAELGVPPDAPVVGTVASFTRDKGHETLLVAAARVRERFPDVRFVLVGAGPLEPAIRRRARALALDETLVFAGYRREAMRLVGAFDVFVLPSVREGLGLALLEAMALGRPVIGTDAGGIPELLGDGAHGRLVPAGNPEALAGAIVALLADPAERARLGGAGRLRAADFDIGNAVRRMEAVYDQLLRPDAKLRAGIWKQPFKNGGASRRASR